MSTRITVTPAYGRDYKSAKAVKADWDAGKDFTVADFFSPWDGMKVNREDATREGLTVSARYDRMTKVVNL